MIVWRVGRRYENYYEELGSDVFLSMEQAFAYLGDLNNSLDMIYIYARHYGLKPKPRPTLFVDGSAE